MGERLKIVTSWDNGGYFAVTFPSMTHILEWFRVHFHYDRTVQLEYWATFPPTV